jgi:hypothetical protein
MKGNWLFEGGEAKSGGLGLLGMMQDLGGYSGGVDTQYAILDADEGAMYFYGNRGDGTIELLAIIDVNAGAYGAIGSFGSANCTYNGVVGISHSGYGVYGLSVDSVGGYFYSQYDIAMHCESDASNMYAAYIDGTGYSDGSYRYTMFVNTGGIYVGGIINVQGIVDRP